LKAQPVMLRAEAINSMAAAQASAILVRVRPPLWPVIAVMDTSSFSTLTLGLLGIHPKNGV
jgi:hypothetical protein